MTLTSGQVFALTTDQKAVFSTAQTVALTFGSPIVLDLNGDGISTQSVENGVKFDLFGVGQKVSSGWVSGGDGLLVMDRNNDGSINGGLELFGEGTALASGKKAANGYVALAEIDSNGDGKVSSGDAYFSELMVWVDGDSDGVSQKSELHTLASLGITELDLKSQTSPEVNNGNMVGLVSSYTTVDGATHDMADVWFATSVGQGQNGGPPTTSAIPVELALTPPVNPLAIPALSSAVPFDDLQTQIGGMVDAMAAFGGANSEVSGVLAPKGTLAVMVEPDLSSGMVRIIDAMKQFDANGQLVPSVGSGQVATASGILKTAFGRKQDDDILAQGK